MSEVPCPSLTEGVGSHPTKPITLNFELSVILKVWIEAEYLIPGQRIVETKSPQQWNPEESGHHWLPWYPELPWFLSFWRPRFSLFSLVLWDALFNHCHCFFCLQPKHPYSYTIVAMAMPATLVPLLPWSLISQLHWESCRELFAKVFSQPQAWPEGTLVTACKAAGLVSSLSFCLQGAAWGQRACPHHLYRELSLHVLFASFIPEESRLGWASSLSSSPQHSPFWTSELSYLGSPQF